VLSSGFSRHVSQQQFRLHERMIFHHPVMIEHAHSPVGTFSVVKLGDHKGSIVVNSQHPPSVADMFDDVGVIHAKATLQQSVHARTIQHN